MYVTGSVVSVNTAVNTPPPVPTSVPASPNTVTPIKGSLSLKTAPSLSATKENNGVIDNFGDETAVIYLRNLQQLQLYFFVLLFCSLVL